MVLWHLELEEIGMKSSKVKVTKTFTLSMYDRGQHTTKGSIPADSTQMASFAESFSPLHEMIEAFASLPLGTKIKVTMEQKVPKKKRNNG